MPNWEEIREEWETSSISFKELAEKHGIKDSTIRSRKNREKWKRNNATQHKNVATQKCDKSPPKKEVKEPVVESDELTDKQRLFCLYYIKSFNATQSAIKAGYAPDSAHVEGSRLLRNVKVSKEIRRIKGRMTNELFIDAMDVLQKWVKIAFADITDYVAFGKKEVPVIGMMGPILDEEGNQVMKEVNYVDFKESTMVDGTIITEAKQGKDGVSIKLADKMKALDFLSKYMDLLDENTRKRLQEEKLKAEINKIQNTEESTQESEVAKMLRKLAGES